MNKLITSIQDKLADIPALQYIDEDWGQLDYYSPNHPVKWPCALIDVTQSSFDNIGKDRAQTPINRQMGRDVISITIGNLKLTNTSGRAPQLQKDNAWSIWQVIEDIHKELQGFRPLDNTSALIRTGRRRVKRDDGVQQYEVFYSLESTNV